MINMKIITISREFGAGGHSVGKKVAEQLGIEFYDKDIIKATAQALGVAPEEIEVNGEQISTKEAILRTISPISYDMKDAYFIAAREAIIALAKKGPCVILGRCADTILAEAGIESFNVFLGSDEIHREHRVGEIIGSHDRNEIRKAMKRVDAARHKYYQTYAGKDWKDLRNYDLVINTGVISYETAIEMVVSAVKE